MARRMKAMVSKAVSQKTKKPKMKKQPEDESYWRHRERDDERRDWNHESRTWFEGYWNSQDHPHRKLIVEAVGELHPESLLEVGCGPGPNLALLREKFDYLKDDKLAGIDVNEYAIMFAREQMGGIALNGESVLSIPYDDDSFDVVLSDAVLLYVGPDKIEKALSEITRVAKKGIILVEWNSTKETVVDHHYARNYAKLLENLGWNVEKKKITKDHWPTKTWIKHGHVFTCRPVSATSRKSSK